MFLSVIDLICETESPQWVWCECPARKSTNQLNMLSGISSCDILSNRVLCHTVSKAFEKSMAITMTYGLDARSSVSV